MTKQLKIFKCKRPICGYEWQSRVEKPKVCPRCKSYDWDKDIKGESK